MQCHFIKICAHGIHKRSPLRERPRQRTMAVWRTCRPAWSHHVWRRPGQLAPFENLEHYAEADNSHVVTVDEVV